MSNDTTTGLKRELTLFHVFCIATGAMVSSGLFILPGLAFEGAGPAVVISYAIAGLFCLAGMVSLAEMTTAMPKAGGDCFTIIRSLGPGVGTVAGVLSWFSLSMKSAFALIGMSIFTALLIDLDIRIISSLFCLLFVVVNVLGIKEAARTQVLLVVGLIALMVLYIIVGLPAIRLDNFQPFAPEGLHGTLSTAGFVFVAYAGLIKIASVAEEVRDPARTIPRGMMLSLLIVSIFYCLMVFVTVGVMEAPDLAGSETPISDGAEITMGTWGVAALSLGAILAFLSTANAGIMTAARSLVPLSDDGLLPGSVGTIHPRYGTPANAVILTGISIFLFLFIGLKVLVEAASVTLILINIFLCLSVIILRESKLTYYQPTYKSPFYPWLQIFGMVSVTALLLEMGMEAILISTLLILLSLTLYRFYGMKANPREYALLHVLQRITDRQICTGTLDRELRTIICERDGMCESSFRETLSSCSIIDLEGIPVSPDELTWMIVHLLREESPDTLEKFHDLLAAREKETSLRVAPGVIMLSLPAPGREYNDLVMVRSKEGITFSPDDPPAHALFIVASTEDRYSLYVHTLMWITNIVTGPDFLTRWLIARDTEKLREIMLQFHDECSAAST